MKKTVRRRHNKDGTVTKTTTYRHKNIFGTTVSDTYTEQVAPKVKKNMRKSNAVALIIFFLSIFIVPMITSAIGSGAELAGFFVKFAVIAYIVFLLFNNVPILKRLVIKLIDKIKVRSANNTIENERK